jgi:hypothetical protein
VRKAWIVAKDSYGDRIVYAVATSEAKAEKLAFAFGADVDNFEIDLYEDDDPVPEYVVLYDYDINDHRIGDKGLLTQHAVLAKNFSPHEEAHRPQVSCWTGSATARNYLTAEEAITVAEQAFERSRELFRR